MAESEDLNNNTISGPSSTIKSTSMTPGGKCFNHMCSKKNRQKYQNNCTILYIAHTNSPITIMFIQIPKNSSQVICTFGIIKRRDYDGTFSWKEYFAVGDAMLWQTGSLSADMEKSGQVDVKLKFLLHFVGKCPKHMENCLRSITLMFLMFALKESQ